MKSFTSLGPFIKQVAKGAHVDQADKLFKKFGEEALKFAEKRKRLGKYARFYLRTAGKEINWLHLRIDTGLNGS